MPEPKPRRPSFPPEPPRDDILRHAQWLLDVCEPGPERDALQDRVDRCTANLAVLQKNIDEAIAEPPLPKTAAEIHKLRTMEILWAFDPMIRMNRKC
jgi:hypothetical protein